MFLVPTVHLIAITAKKLDLFLVVVGTSFFSVKPVLISLQTLLYIDISFIGF